MNLPEWFVKDAIAVYDGDEVEEAFKFAKQPWEGESEEVKS